MMLCCNASQHDEPLTMLGGTFAGGGSVACAGRQPRSNVTAGLWPPSSSWLYVAAFAGQYKTVHPQRDAAAPKHATHCTCALSVWSESNAEPGLRLLCPVAGLLPLDSYSAKHRTAPAVPQTGCAMQPAAASGTLCAVARRRVLLVESAFDDGRSVATGTIHAASWCTLAACGSHAPVDAVILHARAMPPKPEKCRQSAAVSIWPERRHTPAYAVGVATY